MPTPVGGSGEVPADSKACEQCETWTSAPMEGPADETVPEVQQQRGIRAPLLNDGGKLFHRCKKLAHCPAPTPFFNTTGPARRNLTEFGAGIEHLARMQGALEGKQDPGAKGLLTDLRKKAAKIRGSLRALGDFLKNQIADSQLTVGVGGSVGIDGQVGVSPYFAVRIAGSKRAPKVFNKYAGCDAYHPFGWYGRVYGNPKADIGGAFMYVFIGNEHPVLKSRRMGAEVPNVGNLIAGTDMGGVAWYWNDVLPPPFKPLTYFYFQAPFLKRPMTWLFGKADKYVKDPTMQYYSQKLSQDYGPVRVMMKDTFDPHVKDLMDKLQPHFKKIGNAIKEYKKNIYDAFEPYPEPKNIPRKKIQHWWELL